jgi:3-deoxy-manno-octulosonate cytidylyltransferase (CMP-KDO synthetase)
MILGRPMFWHVFQRAEEAGCFESVYLATDDARIFECAKKWNVPALMTGSHHPSGTDRILEAAQSLELTKDDIIVNVQGDEPALDPKMIRLVLSPFGRGSGTQVATLARWVDRKEAQSADIVKLVVDAYGNARYFSRALIPFHSGTLQEPYLAHIGLYAYRMQALKQFSAMGPSPLEKSEKLEQLRLLENGIEIAVMITSAVSIGVDRPSDIPLVEKLLQNL